MEPGSIHVKIIVAINNLALEIKIHIDSSMTLTEREQSPRVAEYEGERNKNISHWQELLNKQN